MRCRDGFVGKQSKSHDTEHNAFLAYQHGDLTINTSYLEAANPPWADQLSLYGWALGEKIGDERRGPFDPPDRRQAHCRVTTAVARRLLPGAGPGILSAGIGGPAETVLGRDLQRPYLHQPEPRGFRRPMRRPGRDGRRAAIGRQQFGDFLQRGHAGQVSRMSRSNSWKRIAQMFSGTNRKRWYKKLVHRRNRAKQNRTRKPRTSHLILGPSTNLWR